MNMQIENVDFCIKKNLVKEMRKKILKIYHISSVNMYKRHYALI